MKRRLVSVASSVLLVSGLVGFSIPPVEASTVPGTTLVLVGKNITTSSDLLTWQIYNQQGALLSIKTTPAPPDSYIETSVEPLATAQAHNAAYVPLPQTQAQFQAAAAKLHSILTQRSGVTIYPTFGTIFCQTQSWRGFQVPGHGV